MLPLAAPSMHASCDGRILVLTDWTHGLTRLNFIPYTQTTHRRSPGPKRSSRMGEEHGGRDPPSPFVYIARFGAALQQDGAGV